ncbi:receptor like protein kinase S.2-like [Bidens hawaiensis]|uniref:receptor like protein kinase S.2-like n=1 Tax=Bidens hawaiensis TaxID=980011 RepID=UPI00404AEDE0
MVAIKRIFSRNDEQGEQGFFAEIEMLSNCKHPNIVSLQGFCDEGGEMILVYKYVSNGCLADYLENIDGKNNLTWAQRIQICLDVAHGLKYLHTSTTDKQSVIHRDIKSANILLDDRWMAKIADFGLSLQISKVAPSLPIPLLGHKCTLIQNILVQIMCGKLAYDKTYGQKGLPSVVRQCFNEGKLNTLVDPRIMDVDDKVFLIIGGVDKDSLDTFTNIAYKCLAETQSERPTMEDVIKELEKALTFQKTGKDNLRISLEAIKHGTQNFSDCNCTEEGRSWKLYEGKVDHTSVLIKRWDKNSDQGHTQFLTEVDNLSRCKHENIIGLVGYCNEENENIIVYEHASNGRLNQHLDDPRLTWLQRLKICIDIANGLKFLHNFNPQQVLHRDIKSGSILLDGDWNAKISNLEMSSKSWTSEDNEYADLKDCTSLGYVDPAQRRYDLLGDYSDIYSLGVILVEMTCGRLAWVEGCEDYSQSLGPLSVSCYMRGKFDEMIFEGIKEQIIPTSLAVFMEIAIKCLDKYVCHDRPKADKVVRQLEETLKIQKTIVDNNLHISLEAIKLGTQNFSNCNFIGEDTFWKLYKGEVSHANGCTPIVAKRTDANSRRGAFMFWTELYILSCYKHENIVALAGYCTEMDEHIIVYEQACNGRLDMYLDDPRLTWTKRLKICIDVANGLDYFHEDYMMHRNIKSGSILLGSDWNAKISNFELSCSPDSDNNDWTYFVHYGGRNSLEYVDPKFRIERYSQRRSDIYSLGVILVEMLCGKKGSTTTSSDLSLGPLANIHYKQHKNLDELIFEFIKEQVAPQSLSTFIDIALQCLDFNWRDRPWASDVVIQLKKALEFQENHETWEPKLPIDYKEIIQASKTPQIYDSEHLYNMFSKGILLQHDKVLFSLGSDGEINERISAMMFWFKNRRSHKWRHVQESRFQKVAEIFDISKLMIQIHITTHYLSLGVNYGAYIIFKFCDTIKRSSEPMYVNLKYKRGGEKLQAYFATWRDDKWMMIVLCRFLSHRKDTHFEVLLESLSRYHCGNSSIYVEGIEFRVIDNDKNKEIEQAPKDQVVGTHEMLKRYEMIQYSLVTYPSFQPFDEQLLTPNEANGMKHLMLSAKEALYGSSSVKHFHLKPSSESRFAF